MKSRLSDAQRAVATYRIMFDELLSPDLAQSLRGASLACAENEKKGTGIIDFLCAAYLQNTQEVASYFRGDFAALVSDNFPEHRYGDEGLIPKAMLDGMVSSDESGGGYGYSVQYDDGLLRLLWLATRLANAVGKQTSFKDVIAALTLDRAWLDALRLKGLMPSHKMADFEMEVETTVFHTTTHTGENWPREVEFPFDEALRPPFKLEVKTPSGRFQPVRSARIKLNGAEVAKIGWPENPTAAVPVNLLKLNKIVFDLDGPTFGSIETTVRGVLDVHNPD